jgi:hypothetical protein
MTDFVNIDTIIAGETGIDLNFGNHLCDGEDDIFSLLDIPTIHKAQDVHNTINYDRRLLELCKSNHIFICNARVGNDRHKVDLTCKDSSIIDYVIASPNILCNIRKFDIQMCTTV